MQPFTGIIIYRSIIALSATLCIFWGYRLFYIVTEKQGQLSVSTGHEQSLQLQDVGPGVFFALFGAAILIASLFRPVIYEDGSDSGKADDGPKAEDARSGAGQAQDAATGGKATPRVRFVGR